MTMLSGYKLMWMMVFFDLPVNDKKSMKAATKFRKFLLDNAFQMAQFSVYLKSCTGKEHTERLTKIIAENIPKEGKVYVLCFTDKQYENIVTFRGKDHKIIDDNRNQYMIFQNTVEDFLEENNDTNSDKEE